MSLMDHLFGKPPTMDEMIRKWKRELKHEERNIERSIRDIAVQEKKTEVEIKKLAAKKDMASAKVLARELVNSRKAKSRLYQSKANLSGIGMQLAQQASMYRMQKTLGKSAQIMAMMNQLVKLPQLNQVMMAMSREMEKAGLIEEMLDDALEDEEVSDEADEQLDMVMDEILQGVKTAPTANAALPAQEVEQTDEADEMQARLAQLKA